MNCPLGIKLAVASFWIIAGVSCSQEREEKATPELLQRGKELFSYYCAGCHPDGENRIYPQKALHRVNLKANGITTAAGIIAIMRAPGKGMKQFDEKTLPDPDAYAIAQYILATF